MNLQSSILTNNTPVFTSWIRSSFANGSDGTSFLKNANDTVFYRKDLDFDKFTDLINEKYKDVPKVNVYNYGCSDCSEAYSLIMSLDTKLGKNAEKFYPVKARDIDFAALSKVRDNSYNIAPFEFDRIQTNTKGNFFKYFSVDWNNSTTFNRKYSAQDCLTNKVDLRNGNLIKDCKTIKPKNSIILARNVWPYIKKDDREDIIKYWSENLDSSSLIVIGSFDYYNSANDPIQTTAPVLLSKYNFVETDIPFVYKKAENIDMPDYITNKDLINYHKK